MRDEPPPTDCGNEEFLGSCTEVHQADGTKVVAGLAISLIGSTVGTVPTPASPVPEGSRFD